jgi:ubiquinol-cytochrome c reductase iron-sulfur subunit
LVCTGHAEHRSTLNVKYLRWGRKKIETIQRIDGKKRRFLLIIVAFLGVVGVACALMPLLSSWLPSAKARAEGGKVQVDLSQVAPGQQITVEWRGKPVWIIRRTKSMLQQLSGHDAQLRDPNSSVNQQPAYAKNQYRSINPEYLVLIGVCPHLGCAPKYIPPSDAVSPNFPGGFYCPCHGSIFDLAGRVFKNVPAPTNLAVPPYQFISDKILVIG